MSRSLVWVAVDKHVDNPADCGDDPRSCRRKPWLCPQFDRRTVQQIESGSNRLLLLIKLLGIARRVFDAVEERTRTPPLRIGIQQMIEVRPVVGHYQVGKFVQDHVVDDVLRHPQSRADRRMEPSVVVHEPQRRFWLVDQRMLLGAGADGT